MSKMRIWTFSDPHLETYQGYTRGVEALMMLDAGVPQARVTKELFHKRAWYPLLGPQPEDLSLLRERSEYYGDTSNDTLVLAGDIWTGTRSVSWCGIQWLKEVAAQFRYVVLVPGNHDLWDVPIDAFAKTMRQKLRKQKIDNVHVLDKSYVCLNGVCFVGGTLWTDMHNGDRGAMALAPSLMKMDFNFIKASKNEPLTQEKWIAEFHATVRAIEDAVLREGSKYPVVVVTHHAPSIKSISDKYRGGSLNPYYASDLEWLIQKHKRIIAWVHGHTHTANRYSIGGCDVICNPIGTAAGPGTGFDLECHFDIQLADPPF